MMEHKSWLWKKKSIEKTMIAADKAGRGNDDELQGILAYEAELERNLNITNEKLSTALAEINAKDDMAKKQTNIAREAILGWEKAEAEVLALKQELEKTTQQMVASEERLYGVDAALKECMQQLRFVREEQENRIHDAVMKTSREYEKTRIALEEKLSESNKRLSKLTSENTQLTNALLSKEKTIDELHAARCQLDSDLSAVMSKLESTQRDNASLSYEVRVLEKELEIRNEERDFNRRAADVAHKQHLESVKRIAKLETEAQRLRILVRKRLPGPAALAKMKNEVEMLGRDPTETSRRKSNPFDQTSEKQINFLTEQLCALEDENRVLKEFINRNTNEQSKSQTSRSLVMHHDFPILASSSDIGSDEKASMAESWAPSCKTVEASDIGLMDDFVEMEKLAIVSVEKPLTTSNLVSENHSDWVENISKIISEHSRITQRRSSDVIEDITVALTQKGDDIPRKSMSNEVFGSDMNRSIERLIELIEGLRLCGKDDSSETPTGYTVRVLQWKTSELGAVLETFLQSCVNLLSGKAELENFTKELTLTLEWIVNHCFSLQDVSSMRHEMEKRFDWDETQNENEADKLQLKEETKNLKDELERVELAKMDLERKLESEISKSESMIVKLEESEKMIDGLKVEVELLKQQKDIIEDQMNVEMKVKEDLDEQLIEAIGDYNDACKIISSEEMEAESIDEPTLIVSKSTIKEDVQNGELDHDEKRLQSELEIIAASEKLAECQETILSLGKQLKALASPRNTSVPEQLSSNPTYESPPPTPPPITAKTNHQRVSLLDKMKADDEEQSKPKEITRTITSPAVMDGNAKDVKVISPQRFMSVNGIKHQEDEEALVNFLSIVPSKKKKGGMLRKLLWRKKKSNK
ncbi:putative filament-like plant protein [Helianthus annuus]|uniref:Filament-like plant protein n=1 Tax=Helianthus annuus TaxID=4232 RepID=A0A251TX65_HELAN|nr:filament-like plant protein 7 isoform X1 [Helianthus annuus]KAF5791700.1 putative filament-like plant protein [Helianthus annuus]KAJ0526725.1 putative filament-like plant protein [Helianthus annuus]KAJ0535246.1 putative filament-like plant protein [Helianthus annuus]KAJ0543119.1 putative filament-like plant protein [Helianthus annuus]KAJ0708171.1 putative filament-like plant protein [Helianthus annuus]